MGLRRLALRLDEFRAAGACVTALCGSTADRLAAFRDRTPVPFPILGDPTGAAFHALGVYHKETARGPVPRPAGLVFATGGALVYRRAARFLRPSPRALLAAVRASALPA